jgi:hypothetical protein
VPPIIQNPPAAIDTLETGFSAKSPAIRTEAFYVVFTTIDETLAAARVARDLAAAMDVPSVLLHFRTVRFAPAPNVPIGISPVETEAVIAQLRAEGVDTRVRLCCCRNEHQAIPYAFKPHSLVVVAGHRGWWPTRSERWRRALETAGHFVVFVDTSAEWVRAVREAELEWGPAATSWSR